MLIAQRTDLILPRWLVKLWWMTLVHMIAVPFEAVALLFAIDRYDREAIPVEFIIGKIGGDIFASAIFLYFFGPLVVAGFFQVYYVWFGRRRRSAPIK